MFKFTNLFKINTSEFFIKKFSKAIVLSAFIVLSGCVGEISNKNPAQTKTAKSSDAVIIFAGIDSAVPISMDAVELYFYPQAGELKDKTYVIRYDGFIGEIAIPAKNLIPGLDGRVHYTVRNLARSQSYSFKIQVRDNISLNESATLEKRVAKTFENPTCKNFKGIIAASQMAGSLGLNSISVTWMTPTTSPGSSKGTYDPLIYEITAVKTSKSITGLNNKSLTPPERVVVKATKGITKVIPGLSSNSEYFVQVRCLNKYVVDNSSNSTIKAEVNHEFKRIKTLSPTGSDVSVDLNSLNVSLQAGSLGLTGVDTLWKSVSGPINHLRMYYKSTTGAANFSSSLILPGCGTNDATPCNKLSFSSTSLSISGLSAFTKYNFTIVACFQAACQSGNRKIFKTVQIKTEPTVIDFSGVSSINLPTNKTALDSLTLNFSKIDLKTGLFDGFYIKLEKQDSSGTLVDQVDIYSDQVQVNNRLLFYDGSSTLTTDLKTATSVNIGGIDPGYNGRFCITLDPFYIQADGTRSTPNVLQQKICYTPNALSYTAIDNNNDRMLNLPDNSSFSGLNIATVSDAAKKIVQLSWSSPTKGVYSVYRVFWRVGNSSFSPTDYGTDPSIEMFTQPIEYLGGNNEKSSYSIVIPLLPTTTGNVHIQVWSYSAIYPTYYGDFNEGYSLNNGTKVVSF